MNALKCALIAFALFIGSAPATAGCTCRAKDVVANEGEVVCLNTPLGQRLARCDKVLNNTSWTFLGTCPTVSRTLTPPRMLTSTDHAPEQMQSLAWAGEGLVSTAKLPE